MNEDDRIRGGPSGPPWLAYSVIALIAVGALVAFYVSQDREVEQRERRRQEALTDAERGSACGSLAAARSALGTDDRSEVREYLREAERKALRALDTSGVAFGRPERIALLLASDLKSRLRADNGDDVAERLESATVACDEIRDS